MEVCGNKVEELVAGLFDKFDALGLVGSNGTDGYSQCGVNSI